MLLVKDGQAITLDNENHIEAYKASGWAEVNTPTPAPLAEEEIKEVQPDEPMNEPIIEEKAEPKAGKKSAGRKKQEK